MAYHSLCAFMLHCCYLSIIYSKRTCAYLYNSICYVLGCSMYLQIYIYIHTDIHSLNIMPNPLYLYTYLQGSVYIHCFITTYITCILYTPSIHPTYTAYTCFIAYLFTTHCIACLYTIWVYTPCKLPRVPILSIPPIYWKSTTIYSCANTAHLGLLLLGTLPGHRGREP